MKNDLNELYKTIERLRFEEYPDLPEDLVSGILDIQTKYCDDRVEASKRVVKLVDDYLSKGV